jgi:hypothetical protein
MMMSTASGFPNSLTMACSRRRKRRAAADAKRYAHEERTSFMGELNE